jgi:formylglycine-generating enzyme required for sulfatase activity
MAGNVWEWTFTDQETINEHKQQLAPQRLERYAIRGGAYDSETFSVRCDVRMAMKRDARVDNLGFRIVQCSTAHP